MMNDIPAEKELDKDEVKPTTSSSLNESTSLYFFSF